MEQTINYISPEAVYAKEGYASQHLVRQMSMNESVAKDEADKQDKVEISRMPKMEMMERGDSMQFSVDEELETVIASIVNLNTKEVIRQIPTEEALTLSKKIKRLYAALEQ